MKYNITCGSKFGKVEADERIKFTADRAAADAFFEMKIAFSEWEKDAFVFMPACVYDGNKFRKIKSNYPPKYTPADYGLNPDVVVTDIPGLNADGGGEIEVTSGDMSVPCAGIFYRAKKQAFFVFTEQAVKDKNIGFSVKEGVLNLSFPAKRKDSYRFCAPHAVNADIGISVEAGETIESAYKIITADCADMSRFYELFFENRKRLVRGKRCANGYNADLKRVMEEHFNRLNWSGRFYTCGDWENHGTKDIWCAGWTGSGMSAYALLQSDEPITRERAAATYDFVTTTQAPSGFYYGQIVKGKRKGELGLPDYNDNSCIVRRQGDLLYFLLKSIELSDNKAWRNSAAKCADALVKLFGRYGTFGQYIDSETGEMIRGGSFAGVIAVAALAKAYAVLNDGKYLETAKRACEYYHSEFMRRGYTYGAAGDALDAVDSESAFAALEGGIVLYEVTREDKWLGYAKDFANLCSSWVVAYPYKFPDGCEFSRLKINATGSVFANVQNKHAAPGIATLSGDSIYKLYQYCGGKKYLELIKDIAYFIPQCVSTEKRPIYARMYGADGLAMPEGYINERVNMSDWEAHGPYAFGEVFYGACWCETSLLLTIYELMDLPEMR